MRYFVLTLIAIPLLGACSHMESLFKQSSVPDFKLDEAEYVEASLVAGNPSSNPEAMLGGKNTYAEDSKPISIEFFDPDRQVKFASVSSGSAVKNVKAGSIIQPDSGSFMNAVQVYPFHEGGLYRIHTAPEQVTDIALQPGEKLMSVSAGDTARWILGDTVSGMGLRQQVHILIKPVAPDLSTNLVVTTSKRTYHAVMKSFKETYMAAVSWRYPEEVLMAQKAAEMARQKTVLKSAQDRLDVEHLNFRYEIKGDNPHWRPVQAFDDGHKVFIQFPARLDQGEAPPLFVVGQSGESQLVNYRVKGTYYVVDRLFGAAELRLGEKKQRVVRIIRRNIPPAKSVGL